jgi:hypothetical protein
MLGIFTYIGIASFILGLLYEYRMEIFNEDSPPLSEDEERLRQLKISEYIYTLKLKYLDGPNPFSPEWFERIDRLLEIEDLDNMNDYIIHILENGLDYEL